MFTDQYLQSCRTVTVRVSEFFMLLKKFFFFLHFEICRRFEWSPVLDTESIFTLEEFVSVFVSEFSECLFQ